MLAGAPSGHIGITMYAENLSFALILFTILSAISIGIKLFAPAYSIFSISYHFMTVESAQFQLNEIFFFT